MMRQSHKMFLQAFMSKGILDSKEVNQLYKTVCEKFSEPVAESEEQRRRRLAEFVITINSAIKPFHMEIRKGVSEDNGVHCYCLVNISESAITRLASDYTPNELELIKKMIEYIVGSDDGTIGSVDCLNLTETLGKKMTKDFAQETLRRLARDNWIRLDHGRYALATRAILELEQYIREQFPNMATACNLCKKLALQGQTCELCGTKLHRACASKYFSRQQHTHCPGQGCNASWDDYSSQGTSAAESTQPEQTTTRESRKRKART